MSSGTKSTEMRETVSFKSGHSILSSQTILISIIFISFISLMLFLNNLMIRYSFEPVIYDFERNWVYNWEYHLTTFGSPILDMNFLAIIFSVILLIMSIAITTENVESREYLVLPVKTFMFFGFLTSLVAFVLQRISVSLFFSEELSSFNVLINLTKQGVLFESLTMLIIAVIMILCSFIYVDSILSYKKPAVFFASSGFIFAFISGLQSNYIFREILTIDYDIYRSRLVSGMVFSQMAELLLILALCIGAIGLFREENITTIILAAVSMISLVIIAFIKIITLILFNLKEAYPTTERYEMLVKRDPILEVLVTTLLILFIILNIGLVVKPGIREVKRVEVIKEDLERITVEKDEDIAPEKIYEPSEIVEEDVEKREAVEPIVIQLCPNCNFEISATHKFCPECGVRIAQPEKRGDKK